MQHDSNAPKRECAGASNQKHLNRPPHGLFQAELKRRRAQASPNWRNTLRLPKSRRS